MLAQHDRESDTSDTDEDLAAGLNPNLPSSNNMSDNKQTEILAYLAQNCPVIDVNVIVIPEEICINSSTLSSKEMIGDTFTIGSAPGNDIWIRRHNISHTHCKIEIDDKCNMYITDTSQEEMYISTYDKAPIPIKKQTKIMIQNGTILDIGEIGAVQLYVFNINDITPSIQRDPTHIRDIINNKNDIKIHRKGNTFILTINKEDISFDMDVYNTKNLIELVDEAQTGLSITSCKMVVDYWFGDIMHYITYTIGKHRKEIRMWIRDDFDGGGTHSMLVTDETGGRVRRNKSQCVWSGLK
eukprot:360122_1